jgi:hypothetical protein
MIYSPQLRVSLSAFVSPYLPIPLSPHFFVLKESANFFMAVPIAPMKTGEVS